MQVFLQLFLVKISIFDLNQNIFIFKLFYRKIFCYFKYFIIKRTYYIMCMCMCARIIKIFYISKLFLLKILKSFIKYFNVKKNYLTIIYGAIKRSLRNFVA